MSRTPLVALAVAATLLSTAAAAQELPATPPATPRWEFLISTGPMVPTGAQRQVLARGKLAAAQLTRVVGPSLGLSATMGWARSRDVSRTGDPKLDVFLYDVGAEFRTIRRSARSTRTLMPFAGIGAGGRSYTYGTSAFDAVHDLAAYGSVGGEAGVRRVQLRVEVRNYLSGINPLHGSGASATRNDVVVLTGLRLGTR